MPSETHRHRNKTNPNHGLQILVEKLAYLKARLHWPVHPFGDYAKNLDTQYFNFKH